MGPNDFLKKDAQTPLRDCFLAAGMICQFSTNFEPILELARGTFMETPSKSPVDARLRFWVKPETRTPQPRLKPYFRGLGHMVFAGFDTQNSLLINLRSRSVLGRFTPDMAADRTLWKTVVFPVLLATLGSSAGLAVLHCACVAWKGDGLLLAGQSGSGKSTLSLALAQNGFDFLSDDHTLFSLREGKLLAWNIGTHMKLCPDAAEFFPNLKGLEPNDVLKGEKVFHLDPAQPFGVARVHCCEPRWILFLDRQSEPVFAVAEVAPSEAATRLERGLPREALDVMKRQRATIDTLVERQCWKLRHGGNPHTVARALCAFISERLENRKPPLGGPLKGDARIKVSRRDPLRRFTLTPLGAELRVMGRTVRLETNSPMVLRQARQGFHCYGQSCSERPEFLWRIVSETDGVLKPPWPEMTAFSDTDLRYVNIGQRSFIAVDLESREAFGFVSENLAKDESGFASIFLAIIFYLSSGTLGLTPISAACVATEGRGLLLFGVPNSGKTTSSYLAGRLGLNFHADQATFLELRDGTLRAWGEFWPAAFRVETTQFQPELSLLTRPLVHRDMTFLCTDKNLSRPREARSVVPSACIFLEREAAEVPRLVPLPPHHLSLRLEDIIPFKDDAGSEADRRAVFRALGELPAYRLLYGSKPSAAALFFRTVLSTHTRGEPRR